jgi:predicted AlkP superfamily phosphohydrolase/phosphomutase
VPGPLRRLLVPLKARAVEAEIQKRIKPAKAERRFFEVHVDGAVGGIRINLRGRESQGKIEPGQGYEALCRSLTRDLLEVINEETGQPLVARVLRPAEIYAGPFVHRMPDLLVEWNREHPILRAFSPKIGSVTHPDPSLRSGDHRPDGMFAVLGPGVPPGELSRAVAVVDFAPTVAALLGLSESDFDGKRIEALVGSTEREVRS